MTYDDHIPKVYGGEFVVKACEEALKEGEWIIHKGHWEECYGTNVMVASQIECPCCHHKEAKTTYKWNYCPNCGAKMKGADNE